MKQKDWVKINFFRDRKNAIDEANQIKLLQENNLYPKQANSSIRNLDLLPEKIKNMVTSTMLR